MIHVAAKHKLVGVPARPDLLNLFPDARRINAQGNDLMLLPHSVDHTRMLRNLGLDVPGPILSQYDWAGGNPFEVQRRTAELLTTNPRAYVLNGMGTGKTRSALWSWHFLYTEGAAKKLLVVAPLSTLNFTWSREVFVTLPGIKAQVLYGTKQKRLERLADTTADVYVINHDGLALIGDALKARTDIDTLVLDELAVYRNGQSQRTKATKQIAARMKWVWGMTGSPTPNAPTDAWGQCSIVTPDTVPKFFGRFRDEVMHRVTQFKWSPKPDALEKVHGVMQPAVRFTLDDVVELPDLVERTVDVDMGDKQKAVYSQMEKEAFTAIGNNTITAMNAGAVLQKLLQISVGYVYTRAGDTVALDNQARLDAITDAVMSSDRKVLVFVPFVHALEGIAKRLADENLDVRTICGDTPKRERDETFNLFQSTEQVKVIVAHPQTMAHGLTLTAADLIIWAAPIASLEIFEQANARIRRVGQRHRQQILMLQSTKAERQLYSRLRAKQKVQSLLLDMFAESTTN